MTPSVETLVARLLAQFHVRLSFTGVSEVIANADRDRRLLLARICTQFLASGDCIVPQHEITRKMVESFEANPSFNWWTVDLRFIEAENEIAQPENLTDELAEAEREEARSYNRAFTKVYDDAKPAFDRLFASNTGKIPENPRELISRLQTAGGSFWTLAANLYARVGRNPPDEATTRRFVATCDPFRALVIAFHVAQYDRCVRPQNAGPSRLTFLFSG